MSAHVKVILKVLPGKAVNRRTPGPVEKEGGAGAGSSRGSQLALQLLEP